MPSSRQLWKKVDAALSKSRLAEEGLGSLEANLQVLGTNLQGLFDLFGVLGVVWTTKSPQEYLLSSVKSLGLGDPKAARAFAMKVDLEMERLGLPRGIYDAIQESLEQMSGLGQRELLETRLALLSVAHRLEHGAPARIQTEDERRPLESMMAWVERTKGEKPESMRAWIDRIWEQEDVF